MSTVNEKLSQWLTINGIGRRPPTQKFHRETVQAVRDAWQRLDQPAESVTLDDVMVAVQELKEYCPSRWNLAVTILRYVTPHASVLKRKAQHFRDYNPPSREELNDLLRELDLNPRSNARWIVRFLLLSGMRHGEANKLLWSDVKEDHILVQSENAKGKRRRCIPFLPGMREVLERLRECKPKTRDPRYHNNREGYVLPDPSFKTAVGNACKRLGMRQITPHCCRHIFASRCIEAGLSLPLVANYLGHADKGQLLARVYAHLLDDHSVQMAKKVHVI